MDNKEIKNAIIEDASSIWKKQLLNHSSKINVEEIEQKAILNPSLKKNLDKIFLKDYDLLKRLAK